MRLLGKSQDESGNVFLAIFGAVAMVAILSGSVMTFMKGPLATAVKLTRINTAETQMTVGAQVAVMATTSQPDSGDCDSDTFVEPMGWRAATTEPHPVNGGLIPLSLGISKKDPWGTEYGYCVWNHGATTSGSGCAANMQAGTNSTAYPVVALISAGPDKTFTTTCLDFATADDNSDGDLDDAGDSPLVAKANPTDDDVIFTYTYQEATAAAGGLWKLKTGDPGTAVIGKNIEATGTASLQGGVLLPDKSLITCDPTTAGLMAKSPGNTGIEICDGAAWNPVSGGAASSGVTVSATLAAGLASFTEIGHIGTNLTSGGSSLLEVSVLEQEGAGNKSQAKLFFIPLNAADFLNNSWYEVLPLTDTGPRNGNFALDINGGNGGVAKIRLRRTVASGSASSVSVTVNSYGANQLTPAIVAGAGASVAGIYRHTGLTQSAGSVVIGSSNIVSGINFDAGNSTSSSRLAVGTTAQRPTCTASLEGAQRWNSQTQNLEFCSGGAWIYPSSAFTPGPGTPPTPPTGSGYLVLTSGSWDGNLGGVAGANSKCLTDLQANDWLGKATAQANGQLVGGKVQAMIGWNQTGSLTSYNPFVSSTTYYFAVSGSPSSGGANFTTNSSGQAPGNTFAWSGANYFNGGHTYWTGRETSSNDNFIGEGELTYQYGYRVCGAWTSNSPNLGSYTATIGNSAFSGVGRYRITGESCATPRRLVCMVHP